MRRLKEEAEEAGYNIKIIVYLRRQDDFLLSWYNQIIKHNITSKNTLTWEEYFDNYNKYIKLDYFNCLKKLEHIFGKENIIARRFDKNYFHLCGCNPADCLYAIYCNTSICLD